ncbi:copper resistance protein CopC [Microbacterium sp. CH12i]|uniref:copper resistance CopC family protein n=1 Tax=Microbacterium sp. CH12i TaxID=1479651 RepID=UPI0004618004|nr:copper resistance CopC family protein [Microbacterium sp. CH12i]KDA04548.1 copper resistance protein CopC [Microbacterium sp. CH12i]
MRKNHNAPTAALVVLLAVTASVLGITSPAAAHDDLVSSYPQAEATIDGSPAEITLTFTADLTNMESASVIEVIDAGGTNVAIDAPQVSAASITQHLAPDATAGVFTVRWKVVSSDGHPISGEYLYTVEDTAAGPAPADPAPAESNSPTPAPSASDAAAPTPEPTASAPESAKGYGSTPSGGAVFPPGLYLVMFAFILAGGVIGVVLMGRQRRRRDREEAENASDDG